MTSLKVLLMYAAVMCCTESLNSIAINFGSSCMQNTRVASLLKSWSNICSLALLLAVSC